MSNETIAQAINIAPISLSLISNGVTAGDVLTWSGDEWKSLPPIVSSTFSDNLFEILDNIDNTKKFKYELTNISTSTTRTATVPNANIVLPAQFASTTNLLAGINTSSVSGTNNTGYGASALAALLGGSGNTAVGQNTGSSLTTGTNNILIGRGANVSAAGSTGQIVLGVDTTGASDNGLTVNPIRSASATANVLYYNTTNKEVTYANPTGVIQTIVTTTNTSGALPNIGVFANFSGASGSNLMSVTITPTKTTNRVRITAVGTFNWTGGSDAIGTIKRGTTDIVGNNNGLTYTNSSAVTPYTMVWIDSPSTTSATTYHATFRAPSGPGSNWNQANSTCILMAEEIT